MDLTGDHLLDAPRERVWAALLDADTLRMAIPGCEALNPDGPGRYTVSVVAAVGPVRARFKGRLQQLDLQAPQRYTLSFEGDGGLAGFAKGSAEVELTDVAGGSGTGTQLRYRAQAQVGGRMAQIGSRLIDATAARLSAEFFDRLARALAPPPAQHAAAMAAAPAATPAGLGAATAERPAARPGQVSIQMPAWVWVYTVTALVLLVGWIAAH